MRRRISHMLCYHLCWCCLSQEVNLSCICTIFKKNFNNCNSFKLFICIDSNTRCFLNRWRLTRKRLADNLYVKQPIYYPTVNGETLSKAILSGSYSDQKNKSMKPSAGHETTLDYNNKENNYFVLEEAETKWNQNYFIFKGSSA